MQSLRHACIFYTSNPRGHTTFFAAYVLSGNLLSFGSFFFNIFSSFSNPVSGTAFSAFHFSNSSTVPSFVLPSSQLGYVGGNCPPRAPTGPEPLRLSGERAEGARRADRGEHTGGLPRFGPRWTRKT